MSKEDTRGNALKMQNAIRHNADEVSSMLSSLGKWEKKMKTKDETIRSKVIGRKTPAPGVRSGGGTVRTVSKEIPTSALKKSINTVKPVKDPLAKGSKEASAAKHTYDVGYKKWESFDIDAALKDDGDVEAFSYGDEYKDDEDIIEVESASVRQHKEATPEVLTPANIFSQTISNNMANTKGKEETVPKARGTVNTKDAELVQRELGNQEFSAGQFENAIKSYTKCLGLKSGMYSPPTPFPSFFSSTVPNIIIAFLSFL